MSKSRGNIVYLGTLLKQGYSPEEIRFFLVCRHYRKDLNYSEKNMAAAVASLRDFKKMVERLRRKAGASRPDEAVASRIKKIFAAEMDNDLDTKAAMDGLRDWLSRAGIDRLDPKTAAGVISGMKEIDRVFRVIF
jgi:cysteinyl-tRNA synthetase